MCRILPSLSPWSLQVFQGKSEQIWRTGRTLSGARAYLWEDRRHSQQRGVDKEKECLIKGREGFVGLKQVESLAFWAHPSIQLGVPVSLLFLTVQEGRGGIANSSLTLFLGKKSSLHEAAQLV